MALKLRLIKKIPLKTQMLTQVKYTQTSSFYLMQCMVKDGPRNILK